MEKRILAYDSVPGAPPITAEHTRARAGVAFGLSAHLIWGFFPLYFKLVATAPALEILGHRVVWSVVFVLVVTTVQRGWDELRSVLMDRRAVLMLATGTAMLSTNWFVFIYAVNSGKTVQASLGYFINPLFSVLLGMSILGERPRRGQTVGLLLAAAGVAYLTWSHGSLPWIALTLAGTFGCYGLIRKTVRAGAVPGMTIEMMLLFIPSVLAILWYHRTSEHSYDRATWIALLFAGVVTSVPYLLFAGAARRLRLMTMGFLQYVTPTCHFLLAVLVFHEQLEHRDLITFGLIWTALAIYSWDSYRAYRR